MTRIVLSSLLISFLASRSPGAEDLPVPLRSFLDAHCVDCHDPESRKGGLDLESLGYELGDSKNFERWVKVLDRVTAGEMPPKKSPRPDAADRSRFVESLQSSLRDSERSRIARDGRATRRRLNRHEYENVLRDLLSAPWLEVKEMLPEDGVAFRFNKVGSALDISYVQMSRYLAAADHALRQAMAPHVERPWTGVTRYYARDQPSFTNKFKYSVFNTSPERATFPPLGSAPQPSRGRCPAAAGGTGR